MQMPSPFLVRLTRTVCIAALGGVLLSACAETKFVMATAKRLGDTNKSEGMYKVGKPYQVAGVWYYPEEDYDYDQTGVASWYGPNFHAKATANGEIYDQWAVTAAHKTLPMPSMVKVTNLDNGRVLTVRINDRGPFVAGRIIDLSRGAAQLLDIEKAGTANVRVQILAKESRVLAERAKAGQVELAEVDAPVTRDNVSSQPVASEPLDAPAPVEVVSVKPVQAQPVQARPVQIQPVSAARGIFIQAGAFSNSGNAERVRDTLSRLGSVQIQPIPVNGRDIFRVRLGPVSNSDEAGRLLAQVHEAGYAGARTIVVD
ncbi:MAG: septal ring lytic transglycosylase RlpA family protein [Alphaproteobacteria bacterium]|nr:septal ring lytic transglycosylase RlpA family protein [Alphaproteobacteria bacterium]MBF0249084.1 septal ring lytic transglycosylase RlpA family protein [Alphaproteobacteria bacterium]